MYTYLSLYIYIYVYTHAYTHVYGYICIYIYISIYIYIYSYVFLVWDCASPETPERLGPSSPVPQTARAGGQSPRACSRT